MRTQVTVGDRAAAAVVGFSVTQIALITVVDAIAAASISFSIAGIAQVTVGDGVAASMIGLGIAVITLVTVADAIATAPICFRVAGVAQVAVGDRVAATMAFLGFAVSALVGIANAVAAGKGVAANQQQQHKNHSHHVLPWFTGTLFGIFGPAGHAAQRHVKLPSPSEKARVFPAVLFTPPAPSRREMREFCHEAINPIESDWCESFAGC